LEITGFGDVDRAPRGTLDQMTGLCPPGIRTRSSLGWHRSPSSIRRIHRAGDATLRGDRRETL